MNSESRRMEALRAGIDLKTPLNNAGAKRLIPSTFDILNSEISIRSSFYETCAFYCYLNL